MTKLESKVKELIETGTVQKVKYGEYGMNGRYYKKATLTMKDGSTVIVNQQGGLKGFVSQN